MVYSSARVLSWSSLKVLLLCPFSRLWPQYQLQFGYCVIRVQAMYAMHESSVCTSCKFEYKQCMQCLEFQPLPFYICFKKYFIRLVFSSSHLSGVHSSSIAESTIGSWRMLTMAELYLILQQVASVVELLREGRGALHTSFACYKFLITYGLMFSILKLCAYWWDSWTL